ncbi:hypothetical protein J6A31_05050 [bacterium]|nr:hypothetical protein [bacterium]
MASLVSILSNVFAPQQAQVVSAPVITNVSTNPFSKNPFVSHNGNRFSAATYAKNQPVRGGYFAGYYNGKQNIVGQRLFVEV